MALSSDEQAFLQWWATRRDKHRKVSYQLWMGLPLGLLFSLPILLNFIAGRYWYKRADAVGASQFNPFVLILAVLLITVFISFFYRRFKWEENEQRYQTFLAKKKRSEESSKEVL